jgi:hypothetical protein
MKFEEYITLRETSKKVKNQALNKNLTDQNSAKKNKEKLKKKIKPNTLEKIETKSKRNQRRSKKVECKSDKKIKDNKKIKEESKNNSIVSSPVKKKKIPKKEVFKFEILN